MRRTRLYFLPRAFALAGVLALGGVIPLPSALPAESGLLKVGSQLYRNVIATFFQGPFLTDADVRIYFTNTRGRITAAGGPMFFHYPGLEQVLLQGEPLPVLRSGPNLLEVRLPPGVHDVEIKAAGKEAPPDLPAGFGSDGTVDNVDQFNARARALKPGDELVVKNGVYRNWKNAIVSASGTSDQPLLIRPETPGGVVFQRHTQITLHGQHIVFQGFRFEQAGPSNVLYLSEGEHLRVTQCQFFGCGDPQYTFAHIVRLGPHCHRSRVDHCFFTGSKSMSVGLRLHNRASAGRDNRIDHNVFRDICRYAGNGQENIQLGGGDSAIAPGCTVEYCLFDHAWGDSEIISNKSSGNVIRYNVAAHCLFSAFTLRQGNDVRFEGNVMVNNAADVQVFGQGHVIANNLFLDLRGAGVILLTGGPDVERDPATDTLIAHNTFLHCPGASVCAEETNSTYPLPVRNIRLANNLLASARGSLIDLSGAVNSHVESNLLWDGSGRAPDLPGPDALVRDLRLEGSGVQVRPAKDSPAVDQGVSLASVPLDRWQRVRPAGRTPDVGLRGPAAGSVAGDPAATPPAAPPAPAETPLYRRVRTGGIGRGPHRDGPDPLPRSARGFCSRMGPPARILVHSCVPDLGLRQGRGVHGGLGWRRWRGGSGRPH